MNSRKEEAKRKNIRLRVMTVSRMNFKDANVEDRVLIEDSGLVHDEHIDSGGEQAKVFFMLGLLAELID